MPLRMGDLPSALPRRDSPARLFAGLASFQVFAMFRRGLFYSYLSIYLHYYLGLTVTETSLFSTVPMVLVGTARILTHPTAGN